MRNKLIAAFACTTALVSTGAASAADLGARYMKAPAYAEPLFNWTGFYVGGHIGGAWTNEQFINNGTGAPFGDLVPGQGYRQRGAGIMGGAQIGYNWQANNYVFGMEGTISGLDNKGTVVNTAFGAADDIFTWRANVLATVVGRAGFTVQNNLFYIKGGYAGVNNRLNVSDMVAPATGSGRSDPLGQRLDRRRGLGVRYHPQLDRRPRVQLRGLRQSDLSARRHLG
ncbi:outer membrane immunogenic protein [Bradyrhizobium japonicum]